MNRSTLLFFIGLVCMIGGFVLAWPLVRASWFYSGVAGKINTVLLIPVDDHTSQVMIAYDFRIGGRGSDIALGYDLVDNRLNRIADPVVPNDRAAYAQRWLEGRQVRVYLDMNRPYDSAFILDPLRDVGGIRPEQGALLVMFGVLLSIIAQLSRIRRRGRS